MFRSGIAPVFAFQEVTDQSGGRRGLADTAAGESSGDDIPRQFRVGLQGKLGLKQQLLRLARPVRDQQAGQGDVVDNGRFDRPLELLLHPQAMGAVFVLPAGRGQIGRRLEPESRVAAEVADFAGGFQLSEGLVPLLWPPWRPGRLQQEARDPSLLRQHLLHDFLGRACLP